MFSNPQEIIKQINLEPGMRVADLGAGSGAYTLAVARVLGSDGRVYAVDVQKGLLDRIRQKASEINTQSVEVVVGDLEKIGGSKIKDMSIDVVIIANILFQIEDKKTFIEEARRILKSGGKLLVVDWEDSFGGVGPEPNAVVPQVTAKDLFESHGFAVEKDVPAGAHHYGIMFNKVS